MTRRRIRQIFMTVMGVLLLWAPFSGSESHAHGRGECAHARPAQPAEPAAGGASAERAGSVRT